jgi:hypothetical protein
MLHAFVIGQRSHIIFKRKFSEGYLAQSLVLLPHSSVYKCECSTSNSVLHKSLQLSVYIYIYILCVLNYGTIRPETVRDTLQKLAFNSIYIYIYIYIYMTPYVETRPDFRSLGPEAIKI